MSHENSNPDYKKDADMPLELIERSALSAIIEVSEQAQSKRRKGDLLYGAIQLPSLSITPEMTQGERAQTVDCNREAYANVLSDSALIKHGIVPDFKNSKVFEMENTGVQYSVRLTEIYLGHRKELALVENTALSSRGRPRGISVSLYASTDLVRELNKLAKIFAEQPETLAEQ
jgi:hypothetical protein